MHYVETDRSTAKSIYYAIHRPHIMPYRHHLFECLSSQNVCFDFQLGHLNDGKRGKLVEFLSDDNHIFLDYNNVIPN